MFIRLVEVIRVFGDVRVVRYVRTVSVVTLVKGVMSAY